MMVIELEGGNWKDRVIIIHLFQGEIGTGVQALILKNPTELIQAHQNIDKKAQLIDQEKHQTVVQDHLSIMKEVDHP